MAGAQRRHKVEAHPAPAFLTEIKRHSFTFHCRLTHLKFGKKRSLGGAVEVALDPGARELGDQSPPVQPGRSIRAPPPDPALVREQYACGTVASRKVSPRLSDSLVPPRRYLAGAMHSARGRGVGVGLLHCGRAIARGCVLAHAENNQNTVESRGLRFRRCGWSVRRLHRTHLPTPFITCFMLVSFPSGPSAAHRGTPPRFHRAGGGRGAGLQRRKRRNGNS